MYLIQTSDFANAKEIKIDIRAPYLELSHDLDSVSSPRLMRTHLPLAMLPEELAEKKPKVYLHHYT